MFGGLVHRAGWRPLLLVGAIAVPVLAGAEQDAFDVRLRVAESAVVVEIPQRLFARSPRARDLVVEVADSTVEVTQVRRLAGHEEWTVLLYVDAPLTASDTLFRSALALARASEGLDAAIPDHQKAGHAAFRLPRRPPLPPERLDLVARLESSPLKRIARQTAGFVTATPEELQVSLRALDRRWLVWFREPELAPRAAVQLRVVDLPRDRDLRAPQWWRPGPDR